VGSGLLVECFVKGEMKGALEGSFRTAVKVQSLNLFDETEE
jgi:hypothetical protein